LYGTKEREGRVVP